MPMKQSLSIPTNQQAGDTARRYAGTSMKIGAGLSAAALRTHALSALAHTPQFSENGKPHYTHVHIHPQ